MKSLLFALALAAAPLTASAAGTIDVQRPWSRPAVAGTNAVGYMVLANHGAADVLEKVASPIASRVEMHSSSMVGGIMSMQREDKVAVPAGGQVTFGPGAYHLMFLGLNRTLKAGDRMTATLSFASGARIKVSFPVSTGLGPPAAAGTAR
jgi:copper(I)-binding protein